MDSGSGRPQAGGQGVAGDSIVLEEEIDQNYVPSEEEVREYAKWLGMELGDDVDLFWIAKEGLKAPLPENWKPCKTVDTDEIYYFNFATGESTWDHPCDEYYRKLYEEEKKKKMTKDKAKHDKSKQQAKKDVSQLLGKEKKKKGRPTAKRSSHQPSPERIQAVSSPSSSIFDRKPLPGIGRQPLHRGDAVDHQVSGSSPVQSDKALVQADRSPSRTQASSLVGHRLSQHLSVSVGSEDGDEKSQDQKPRGGTVKPAPSRTPVRSREESEGAPVHGSAAGRADIVSEHEAVLRELRKEHARDLDALEQAHTDTKRQFESDNRRDMASKKRQWAASAEAQREKAQDALNHELQETRAKHSREIDKLESSLLDTKERLDKAIAETEVASEAANAEKATLESALAELRRQVVEEKNFLREAREAARKVQGAGASQPDEDLRRELTLVISHLEDERKHVAKLESQLKEANNGAVSSFTEQTSGIRPGDEASAVSQIAQLRAKLEHTTRENESLRKEAARVTASKDELRRIDGGGASTAPLEDIEVNTLRKALEETEMRLSGLERAKGLSVQNAKDAAAALVDAQEKLVSVESDNRRLVQQIARYNERDASSSGPCNRSLVENAEDAAIRQRETEEMRADLEAARNEVACYAGEIQKSKELEVVVRNELHTAQLALRQSELKVAELNGNLATAEHEKALGTAAVEELRLESARLKRTMEVVHSAAEGDTMRDISDALKDELKELRTQLAAMAKEREGLNEEVGALKQQFVSSEGVHKAERGMFDSSLASKERHVESLQTTVKRLEAELLAGQRREEALHAAAKILREKVAASKLEAWRSKEKLSDTAAVAERIAADLVRVKQESAQRSDEKDSETVTLAIANVETAKGEARDLASRLQLAEEQVGRLHNSLQETTAKLVDSQREVTSVQLSSERAVSNMVSKEELAKARTAEKEIAQRLEEALSRCAKAEESLARACDDRLSLETALRDAERARDAQSKDALSVLANEYRDATSQTSVNNKEYCDLERNLSQSHQDLERARADLASSKKQTSNLQQQLMDSNAGVNKAMHDARHISELASTRQQELIGLSEREQAALEELRQVRISLKDAEKDRERALGAAEQAKHHFASAEREWRREAEDLRAALKEALTRDRGKDENNAHSEKKEEAFQPSTATNWAQPSFPQQPQVAVTGGPAMPNERPQPSTSGVSDATSQGLAEELMQKLTDETKQRRSTRQALSDKASRSWTKKLNEERRMLALAKEAVKHHKERVKKRQQRLLLYQARWRDQRQLSESSSPANVKPRHGVRQTSLEDAKRELDSEVHKLNKFVKQLRSSKNWLDRRERKIFDFETLLGADASGSDPRPQQQGSTGSTSGAQSSSPESSSAKLRSLEAMQQELDNDLPDFTASSSIGGFSRSRPMRGDRKSARDQQHASKKGKENALPRSRPMFPMDYPTYSAFPVPLGFWEHPSHAYLGEHPRSQGSVPSEPRASRRQHNAYLRDRGLSGAQGTVGDAREYSESDLQGWLDRPELDETRNEIRSTIAARERREHFAKLTVEGRQAQSTVALHVDWLNKLREEMGLLGFHSTKAESAKGISGISAAVDALVSPRQATCTNTRSPVGVQSAQEV